MATYQRQTGTNDVYDVSGATPRYISYDEAMKNNIWGNIIDTPNPINPTTPAADSGAGIAGSAGYNFTLTPEEQAAQKAQADWLVMNQTDASQTVDPNVIYQNKLKESQAQIDAMNNMYADQLNKARSEGLGRIQSRQFSQGRSGQIGSGTGEAGINAVQNANTEVENSIRNEQMAAIASIMSNVRNSAAQDLKDKTAAKRAGAEALLTYYADRPAKKKASLTPVITSLLNKGIDPATLSADEMANITNGLGVSKDDVLNLYKEGKDAKDLADADKKAKDEVAAMGLKLNQAQLDKYKTDVIATDRKFEEDKRQWGEEFALKEKTIAEDKRHNQALEYNASEGKKGGNNELVDAINSDLKNLNKIGQDGKVAWSTYQEMRTNWINNGGAESEFKANFPIGTWLNESEQAEYSKQNGSGREV